MPSSNQSFTFRRFTVCQSRCAMKVGTDGVLLGAWAAGGNRILDAGTGTGLIALMMAQRFPAASVLAVDIDADAAGQAAENVAASPFRQSVTVRCQRLQDLAAADGPLDSIVCNPPFFTDSLLSPDRRRTTARHAVTLSFADIMSAARRLLSNNGRLSVIIPAATRRQMDDAAIFEGLFVTRVCEISTAAGKIPSRQMVEYAPHPGPADLRLLTIGDEYYRQLVADFYL